MISKAKCITIIGDIVGSRNLGVQRPKVQTELFKFLSRLNRKYKDKIISKFTITTGDEFQGLIDRAEILPDLIWELEIHFSTQLRLGIGCGILNTELQNTAIGMDGPAWYSARDAIKKAHTEKKYGGVFKNFGEIDDIILNGFARILHNYRERLTQNQINIINLIKDGSNQVNIADKLRITKQGVSKHLIAADWSAYEEAETGWRKVLENYDFSQDWKLW